MSQKVILISDPGIDGAFALTTALHDPNLEVLALLATPGNVGAAQATKNIQVIVEQVDPPRWPRLGTAPPVEYAIDGKRLHGPEGLGGAAFATATLHHEHPSEKLLVALARQNPKEVTVVCLGPATVISRAFDLCADLSTMVKRFVCVGGSLREPGNAGPVSEFHFACDPGAARQVMLCGAPITLIPLDVMRKVLFSPSDLLSLPSGASKACWFLRQIVPFGISASSNVVGIEGCALSDLLGIVAVTLPEALGTRPMRVDVETRGEITRGMSVFDERPWQTALENVDLAVQVDERLVRAYIERVLKLKQ